MNFEATGRLMAAAKKYVNSEHYTIKTEGHKNYRGIAYTADYVEIISDPNNAINFEVTEDEIVVCFFSDHVHFCDYGMELEDDDPDYIERAVTFLEKLFTLPIERKYTRKGDRVIRDESLFVLSETERESCGGITFFLAGIRNLFKKEIRIVEVKKFDAATGNFITVIE